MNTEKANVGPEVIALDFYDGVTEGMAISVKDCGRCYFKLVAWDENQDQRLFAVCKIDAPKYDQLLNLLTRSQEPASTPVWIPKWSFLHKKDEQEANEIIALCRTKLPSSKLLAFGKDISDQSIKIIEIDDHAMDQVARVLKRGKPDDLAHWQPVLS